MKTKKFGLNFVPQALYSSDSLRISLSILRILGLKYVFFIPVVALIIKCQFKPTLAARATPDNTVKCYILKKYYVIVASINLIMLFC